MMRSAAMIALALVACDADRAPRWRPAGNPTPRDGGTLRFAVREQVRTLDPAIAYDEASFLVLHALFDTLVDYGPAVAGDTAALRPIPRLAERWVISPDGLVYTFTLRPGMVYSDGTPVVAADVQRSLERARDSASSPFGSFLADVAELSAPSERELVIRLARPNAAFLFVLAMPFTTPQPAAHLAAAGDQLRRRPLGCGPFVLDSWDEGRRLVLRKNPRYWDPRRVHLDALELRENVPRDTQFLMFERGELDTAERLASPDLLWVTRQAAWQPYVHRRVLMNAYGSRMHTERKPFDDRRVRQALNYALAKHHTVKLLHGAAIPSHGVLIPGMPGRDEALAPYPYDPARARALLAEAGYPDGFSVDYVIPADEEAELLATSLQADLAAVGVRVRIVPMAFATYAAALGSRGGPAFAKVSWIGDYPDPAGFFDPLFHSRAIADDGATNWAFYRNPALDAVLDAARAEREPTARAALYQQAERIVHDDAPWLWDYHQSITEVVQPYVAGYAPHPVWTRDYTSAWLDVGPDGKPVPR